MDLDTAILHLEHALLATEEDVTKAAVQEPLGNYLAAKFMIRDYMRENTTLIDEAVGYLESCISLTRASDPAFCRRHHALSSALAIKFTFTQSMDVLRRGLECAFTILF